MTSWKKFLAASVLAAGCAQAWAVPTLTTVVTPAPATPGSTVSVAVNIADIADLYAYNFSLSFNASLLQLTGYSAGAFLGGPDDAYFGVGDASAGFLSYVYGGVTGPDAGISGSGTLATFTFQTLGSGISGLNFSDVLFVNSSPDGNGDIAVTAVNGTLAVQAPVTPPTGDVPEPASWMLIGVGLVAAGALRRRRVGGMAAQA
ncbi:cohesin domain-containing protein [Massilia phyllosphaerae]|uniref:cohesin domain-containing protein n=1 Tax=Massilia phyllosphaerae TaxID=3106034 RepID=UPI002B1CD0AC|nr:cohesin domain-containing protein [Massilia sp. SGZ-792]